MSGIKHATCSVCNDWPCCCVEAECRKCEGEGRLEKPESLEVQYGGPYEAEYSTCPECDGTGWIKCQRGGDSCPFDYCYCEAAWERQQETNASEPPPSADERHQQAFLEKQKLRS
jgi:hypothetical protein